jgi:chemotaxis protein MotB
MSKERTIGRHRGGHGGGHGGGHHGGAWKVAYADFTTAMMAFFMLMWILAASSPKQKKAIAQYFRNDGKIVNGGSFMTGNFDGGSGFMLLPPQNGVMEETKALEKVGKELGESLEKAETKSLRDQVSISMTDEGLVIEVTDDPQDELFAIGSASMNPEFAQALDAVAQKLKQMPNAVRLEGYTDARQYPDGSDYSNWELSVDRANAARRRLESHGLARERFESVVGYGDGRLAVPSSPLAPGNRRITITVLRQYALAKDAETKEKAAIEGFVPVINPFTASAGPEPPSGGSAAAPEAKAGD